MAFLGLFGRTRHERAGFELYGAAVRAARNPYYYAELGVPDSLDGRFDMIGLFVVLVIRRVQGEAAELAQAVFDAMFADMDFTLREMGVGDMSIGRKVKAMWEALNGRNQAYAAPLASGDAAALAQALARNVWRGLDPGPAARTLAELALAQERFLAGQALEDLRRGKVEFLPARVPA